MGLNFNPTNGGYVTRIKYIIMRINIVKVLKITLFLDHVMLEKTQMAFIVAWTTLNEIAVNSIKT